MKFHRSLIAVIALGSLASVAHAAAVLSKVDFVSARVIERGGRILVRAKTTRAWQAKVRDGDTEITIDIAGNQRTLRLPAPITGDKVEFGPYSREEAQRIVQEINRRI